jgi:hypothetical protein
VVDLASHITAAWIPPLGANTADTVTRHPLARHGVADGRAVDAGTARGLHDTLRRGLVAFVGPERVQVLASRCLEPIEG